MPTITDIAWAAGLMDGEGYITIHRGRVSSTRTGTNAPYLVAGTRMCSKEIPVKLQLLFGGKMYHHAKTSTGKIIWEWVVAHKKANNMINTIFPFLVNQTRTIEAALAMEFQSSKLPGPGFIKYRGVRAERYKATLEEYRILMGALHLRQNSKQQSLEE